MSTRTISAPSALPHHHKLDDKASSMTTTVLICSGSAFMIWDLSQLEKCLSTTWLALCLTVTQNYVSGKDLGEHPYVMETVGTQCVP
jgi:hypothetical protein